VRPSKLQLPDLDLPDKFTPFFRCKQRTHVSITELPDKIIVVDILTYRGLIEFVVQAGWPYVIFRMTYTVQSLIGCHKKTCKHSRVGRRYGHVMSLIGLVASVGYSLERVWFHLSLDMDDIAVTHMEIIR
jgi:hypothetical protein